MKNLSRTSWGVLVVMFSYFNTKINYEHDKGTYTPNHDADTYKTEETK